MLQRGDMQTLHEPFLYLYYIGDGKKDLAHFDPEAGHPTDYSGIKAMIAARAAQEQLFIKDMSYFVLPYLRDDHEFVRAVQNTFLIRSPALSVPSYYRLDPEVTREEIGHDALFYHFELVADSTGETPIVIDAEDLTENPEGTMRAYCQALGIPFIESSLKWDAEAALPKAWSHVSGWHADLASSTGLHASKRQAVSFDDSPEMKALFDYQIPFYEKLREHRLAPVMVD